MNIFKYISVLTLGLFFMLSCEKDDPMVDTDIPVINLMSPSSNMFMNGDTVHIHAEITDNDELHEISAKIERTANGLTEEVWSLDTHSHLDVYALHDMYVIEVNGMHNDFKLSFTVSDHNGNIGTKEFSFHVM